MYHHTEVIKTNFILLIEEQIVIPFFIRHVITIANISSYKASL